MVFGVVRKDGPPAPLLSLLLRRQRDHVAPSWRHTTARAVEGRPADPQLHSHVLLHAAGRKDGQVVAIDSRSWLAHRRELGAAYRTELARGLVRLGYRVRRGTGRGGRYFELDGVPQRLIDQWSSRHHQVKAAIDQVILAGLTEFDATFSARDARAVALETSCGARIQDALARPSQLRAAASFSDWPTAWRPLVRTARSSWRPPRSPDKPLVAGSQPSCRGW